MLRHRRDLLTSPSAWLAVLAIVIAAPTLSYVFGRDQAHHYYVARWWLEGYIPYRDTFHEKQPMLYLTHLLAIALGGFGTVGIRIVDLLATLGLGALVVVAVDRNGRRPARGEIGAGMLLATAFYFGTLDYWDTAHAEYWQAIWLVGAWLVAQRAGPLLPAALGSGVLSSIAVLYKPTAAVVALGVAAVVLRRAWSSPSPLPSAARAASAHLAGGLAPVLCFAAYFASTGALRDWYESTILFPAAYADAPTPPAEASSLLTVYWLQTVSGWTLWFAFAWSAAMTAAWRDRDNARLRGGIEAAGLLGLSVVTVVVQRKYFVYHWALAMPFLLSCGAFGLAGLAERRRQLAIALAVVVSLQGVLQAPVWVTQYYGGVSQPLTYRDYAVAWWQGETPGDRRRPAFVGPYGFNHDVMQGIAAWIAARAQPHDRLIVRGFESVIYTLTDMRAATRFQDDRPLSEFSNNFPPSRAWRQEHEETIARMRPRFVVTTRDKLRADLARLGPIGYREAFRHGQFVILVTDAASPR